MNWFTMNKTRENAPNTVINCTLFCRAWVNPVTLRQWTLYLSMFSSIILPYYKKNEKATWIVSKCINSRVSRLNLYPISYRNICMNKKNRSVVTHTPNMNAETNYSFVEFTFSEEFTWLNVFSPSLRYTNFFMNSHSPTRINLISSAS